MESGQKLNHKICILYVEDELDARDIVSGMLAKKYPDVILHTAGNGSIGLELFKKHQPQIVITDICMPVMDGLKMSEEIKSLAPETFIVAVTAYSDTNYLLNAIEIGINHYVLKPIDSIKLWSVIDKCIDILTLQRKVAEQNEHIRKLSRAVEESPCAVIITDAIGSIEYVNPKFTQMTGYELEDVVSQSPRVLSSGTIPSGLSEELWSAITSGHEWRGEYLHRAKDNELFWASASISPVLEPQTGAITDFIVIEEDITDRKRSENALRESEARYRHFYHAAPVMLHSIDRNGRLVDVSDFWLKSLGYERDEVIGKKFSEFLTEPYRRFVEEVAIAEFFTNTSAMDVPYQLVKKNGECIDFLLSASVERNSQGQIYRSLAVMVDVTELKKAEDELRQSEARYRLLFKNSIDAILLTTPEGNILEANPEACLIFGKTEEELCKGGRGGIFDLTDPRLAAALQEQNSTGMFKSELTALRGDGTRFPVEVSSSQYRDKSGRKLISLFIRDISERRAAGDQIETLQAELTALLAERQSGEPVP